MASSLVSLRENLASFLGSLWNKKKKNWRTRGFFFFCPIGLWFPETFLLLLNRCTDLINSPICLPEENGVNKTYRWVHVQDLFVPLAPEEKAVGVVVNHLKVGARVRRGRLSLPVVEAAAEKGGTSNL